METVLSETNWYIEIQVQYKTKHPHISEFVTDSSIAHNMLLNWKVVLTKLKLGIPKLIFPHSFLKMRVVCLAVSFASISCDAYYISTERTSIDVSSDRSPFNLYNTKGPQKNLSFVVIRRAYFYSKLETCKY